VQQSYVGDLIYNRDEAWDYYQRFVKVGTEWHALYYFAAECGVDKPCGRPALY